MKTIFRPNINKKKRKKNIIAGILFALILIMVVFPGFSLQYLSRPFFYIFNPFFNMKKNLDRWRNDVSVNFREKKDIANENIGLREKIAELQSKISLLEVIEKENSTLKFFISATTTNKELSKQNFLIAGIIFRPPQIPYDTLIIDAGSKDGIREGMTVTAFGNALLGYTEDVFRDTSKVKLVSSFGEETNIILELSGNPAIAIGRGGENFEVALPRAISVKIGERALTLGKQPMLVGIIERIEHQTSDPYQKIFFRMPVNIQALNQVFIIKK